MPHVVIVNPSDRPSQRKARTTRKASTKRKGATVAKKQRTAAQKAATRKMIAANRARSRPARKAPARKVSRAKPAARRTPAKRRARRSHPITPAAVATRAGRQLRYRRKNPVGGFVKDTLMPSVIGGGGALALDVLLGVLPLPAQFKTGPMAPVVKVAGAIGLGYAAGMVVNKRTAEQIAAGALTVTFYNIAKGLLVRFGGGKIPGLAEYVSMYPDGVGAYVSGDEVPQVGYVDSGMQVGELVPDGMGGYETGVYR